MSNQVDAPPAADIYLGAFAALSDPIRVRILHMLARKSGDELACTTLDETLPVGKSTISYHIGILRRAGLISVRKVGRQYFYQPRSEVLAAYAPSFWKMLQESETLDFDSV